MASKPRQIYQCSECQEQHAQWRGQCDACGAWNTMAKFTVVEPSTSGGGGGGVAAASRAARGVERAPDAGPAHGQRRIAWMEDSGRPRPQSLAEAGQRAAGRDWRQRMRGPDGAEFNRVLGGGLVPGSLLLLSGDPGIGKSTLMLQVAGWLAARTAAEGEEAAADAGAAGEAGPVLYVSAEESVEQVGSRAQRLGMAGLDVLLVNASKLEDVLAHVVKMRPRVLVLDSIQTVYLDEVSGSAGSITQVRECATALLHVAKRERLPVFLVGHVTKGGDIAGPKTLEHIVDVVLYLEGERHQPHRVLRSIKNRYGTTDEVGAFNMTELGLTAVQDTAALFRDSRAASQPGANSAVTVAMEGSRAMLVEVQALCAPTSSGGAPGSNLPPRRIPNGMPLPRLMLLAAVLTKHARLRLYTHDIYVNVVGGLTLVEPAADLAIAVAVASSFHEQPVPHDIVVMGEIGLGGELRPVANVDRRIAEAAKFGFRRCVLPATQQPRATPHGRGGLAMEFLPCKTVAEALAAVLGVQQAKHRRSGHGSRDEDNDEEAF